MNVLGWKQRGPGGLPPSLLRDFSEFVREISFIFGIVTDLEQLKIFPETTNFLGDDAPLTRL